MISRFLCLLVLVAPFAMADVQLQTSINDVWIRGPHELLGSVTASLDDNDFDGASAEDPIYIRVIPDMNARLADTLVDQNAADTAINGPIYLALETNAESYTVTAPPESVSIVRWVAAENEIWFRIQTDSSTWLSTDGGETMVPPSDDAFVSWTFGISARSSASDNASFLDGGANLPFNTRNLNWVDESDAVSTMFCANLTESSLTSSGLDSVVSYDIISYASDAELSPGVYGIGSPMGTNFTSTFSVARGKERMVDHIAVYPPSGSIGSGSGDGLIDMTDDLILELDSMGSANTLETHLYPSARLVLTAPAGSGFPSEGARFVVGCDTVGATSVDEADAFTIGDETLYSSITLTWKDEPLALSNTELRAAVRLSAPSGISMTDGSIAWSLTLPNHDGAADEAPFDGPQQNRRCAQSSLSISGAWFVTGRPASDRYLGHVTLAGGNFTTALSLRNPEADPEGFLLCGYDAQGNLLGGYADVLAGGETMTTAAPDLFGDPSLSHLKLVANAKVHMGATYRAVGTDKAPADVFERRGSAKEWRLETGDPSLTFDGIAVVNVDDAPAMVEVLEIDSLGSVVETTLVSVDLSPGAKVLHVLSPQGTGTHFEVRADHEVTLVALRGTHDSSFLWVNPADPIN